MLLNLAVLLTLVRLRAVLPVENGIGLCTLNNAFQLSACVVFCQGGDLTQVDRRAQNIVLTHHFGMNLQYFLPSILLGQADLDMNLKATRPENCLINEVLPVGYTDDENVVELLETVDTGQELVDNQVIDPVTTD